MQRGRVEHPLRRGAGGLSAAGAGRRPGRPGRVVARQPRRDRARPVGRGRERRDRAGVQRRRLRQRRTHRDDQHRWRGPDDDGVGLVGRLVGGAHHPQQGVDLRDRHPRQQLRLRGRDHGARGLVLVRRGRRDRRWPVAPRGLHLRGRWAATDLPGRAAEERQRRHRRDGQAQHPAPVRRAAKWQQLLHRAARRGRGLRHRAERAAYRRGVCKRARRFEEPGGLRRCRQRLQRPDRRQRGGRAVRRARQRLRRPDRRGLLGRGRQLRRRGPGPVRRGGRAVPC